MEHHQNNFWSPATTRVGSLRLTSTEAGGSESSFITSVDGLNVNGVTDEELLENELERCGGVIIDTHLHTAPWMGENVETLLKELKDNSVAVGLLYNPYTKWLAPYDHNDFTAAFAADSDGKVFSLASLNTTHDDWGEHREEEMERLRTGLDRPQVLGTKLAPPHSCLPLTGPIMDDIMEVVSESRQKLLALHIGTTPFCGELGKQMGVECRCEEEYVNPALLIPKIEKHPDVTFCLLHSGHEFLPEGDPFYYDFVYCDNAIYMAQTYPNVYLSLSALFAQDPDGTLKYPGGFEVAQKMKEANVTHKVFWGSDASFIQGQIKPVLVTAIKAMIKAGWTEEERTWALHGCGKKVFKFPIS